MIAKNRVLKKDIVIPAGSIFVKAPVNTRRFGIHLQYVAEIDKDNVGFFTLAIEDLPDGYFEEIQ